MIFKKAVPSDLDVLYQIESESFNVNSFVMSRQNLTYHTKKSSIFVCECDGIISGYILLLMRKNSPKSRIYSLAVKENFRGCGIAIFLLENIFLYSKENVKSSVKLEVRLDNAAAIGLYKKVGFLSKKIIKSYYPDGVDALSMERIL